MAVYVFSGIKLSNKYHVRSVAQTKGMFGGGVPNPLIKIHTVSVHYTRRLYIINLVSMFHVAGELLRQLFRRIGPL